MAERCFFFFLVVFFVGFLEVWAGGIGLGVFGGLGLVVFLTFLDEGMGNGDGSGVIDTVERSSSDESFDWWSSCDFDFDFACDFPSSSSLSLKESSDSEDEDDDELDELEDELDDDSEDKLARSSSCSS